MIDRKHVKNLAVLIFAHFLFVWNVWQHEIMMLPYMATRWNTTFQFFTFIVVPWGFAYDFTLAFMGLCLVLIDIAFLTWD